MSWKRPNAKSRLKPLVTIPQNLNNPGIWVDLGTGEGLFADILSEILPNALIIRIDVSNYSQYGELGFKSYIEKLGLRKKSISGFIGSQVFHFFSKPKLDQNLDTLNKLLVDSGYLLIIEYMLNRSYSWIPHPININYWRNYVEKSSSWNLLRTNQIEDGSRPKYSILLQRK